MSRDFIYRSAKAAEYAFKRSQFKPEEHGKQDYPWFTTQPGGSFFIPSAEKTTESVRRAASTRTKKSGYEFSVSKQEGGTLVTRKA